MKKSNTHFLLYATLLGVMVTVSGCTSVLPIGSSTPISIAVTPTATPDSQTDENLVYTSDDAGLTIALPDQNWVNTADTDSRRTFLADEVGILTICHYLDDYADTVVVPKTQNELVSILLTRPSIAEVPDTAYSLMPHTIMSFSYTPGSVSSTYQYEISFDEGNKVRYEIVWGMQAAGEVYEVVGRLYTSDSAEIEKLRASILSTALVDSNYTGIVRTASSYSADHADTSTAGKLQYRCTQSANVRDQASASSSKVIGELAVGETIDVIAEVDGWLEFQYNGQTAYVYGEYMQRVEASVTPAAGSTTP